MQQVHPSTSQHFFQTYILFERAHARTCMYMCVYEWLWCLWTMKSFTESNQTEQSQGTHQIQQKTRTKIARNMMKLQNESNTNIFKRTDRMFRMNSYIYSNYIKNLYTSSISVISNEIGANRIKCTDVLFLFNLFNIPSVFCISGFIRIRCSRMITSISVGSFFYCNKFTALPNQWVLFFTMYKYIQIWISIGF